LGEKKEVKTEDSMNKVLRLTALLVGLALPFAGLALAQKKPSPTLTNLQQGLAIPQGTVQVPGFAPAFCSPCLFYAGDSDPTNINGGGLWDNNSADIGILGQVYSPFTLPKKTDKCGGACSWVVTGLFANIEYYPNPPIQPNDAVWAIYSAGVSGDWDDVAPPLGTPFTATTVCSGVDPAPVLTDTGRNFFGFYEEYATAVAVSGCTLTAKDPKNPTEYWEQVTPEFAATGTFELAYESNVTDTPPPEAFGLPQPKDDSWFYSPSFGFNQFTAAQTLGPFDFFSAGVEGTLGKKK
jgi:hypothetical protein